MRNKLRLNILLVLAAVLPIQLNGQCYELVWADEFDYLGLPNSEYWSFEEGGGGFGNNEIQYYTANDTDNCRVDGEKLIITAKEESYGGRDYTSARIITRDKFNFQYGKIEARIKLPYTQGIWPAFWMMGESITDIGWPDCGEIDIMEFIGGTDTENKIYGTAHWDNDGSHASYGNSYTLSSGRFADDYHTFSVEWTSESIRWFIDDIQFHVIDITDPGLSEFHDPFFILLNVAVGGDWPGYPDATSEFPQTMEVDYVRVYKASDEIESIPISGDSLVAQKAYNKDYSLPYSSEWNYSWDVPEGIEILSGQGSNKIYLNWGCDDATLTCNITGTCGSYSISKEIKTNNIINGPDFISENEESVLFYIDSLSASSLYWNIPSDASIVKGQSTDSIIVNWGSSFENISLDIVNSCGTQQIIYEVVEAGLYPYPDIKSPNKIPGNIEAVNYDYGGEGLAYHDLTDGNAGSGPRQDQNVDTEYNDDGNPNVGWITTGEWLKYTIKVDSSSWYKVNMRVATENSSGGPFSLWFNNEERIGDIDVPGTGGWSAFTDLTAGIIYLTTEDTIMMVNFDNGGFNLGKMSFTATTDPTGIEKDITTEHISVYPNPSKGNIFVLSGKSISTLALMDMDGQTIINYEPDNQKQINLNIDSLKTGIYILKLQNSDGEMHFQRIIKIN